MLRLQQRLAARRGGEVELLEPVGALPVIVEDDVLVGGNTGIYEGAVIKQRAVIAAGTILTGSTPVYDLMVPGRDDASMMDWLARLGYDVWCFDCEGYGRSDKSRAVIF